MLFLISDIDMSFAIIVKSILEFNFLYVYYVKDFSLYFERYLEFDWMNQSEAVKLNAKLGKKELNQSLVMKENTPSHYVIAGC